MCNKGIQVFKTTVQKIYKVPSLAQSDDNISYTAIYH